MGETFQKKRFDLTGKKAVVTEALKRKPDSRLSARLNIFRNENQGGDHV